MKSTQQLKPWVDTKPCHCSWFPFAQRLDWLWDPTNHPQLFLQRSVRGLKLIILLHPLRGPVHFHSHIRLHGVVFKQKQAQYKTYFLQAEWTQISTLRHRQICIWHVGNIRVTTERRMLYWHVGLQVKAADGWNCAKHWDDELFAIRTPLQR